MITFSPHTGSVTALVFRSDGSRLASVSSDGSLRVWDTGRLGQGDPVWEVSEAHKHGINHAQFAPDGSLIYTGGSDGLVKGWNATDGVFRVAIDPFTYPEAFVNMVNAFVISLCGRFLAYGGGSMWLPSEIVVARTPHLAPIRRLSGHTAAVGIFAAHERGFISGSADQTVRLWDWESAECRGSIKFRGVIRGLACSRDGRSLAVAGGSLIHLHDAFPIGTEVLDGDSEQGKTLRGHTKRVECIEFSPDGVRLASASEDGTVRVWDAATGSAMRAFAPRLGPLHWVTFAPDGLTLAFSSRKGHVGLLDLDD